MNRRDPDDYEGHRARKAGIGQSNRDRNLPVFSVRYRWPGGRGNSVASGPDRESALAAFQAQNPHVEVEP